MDIFAKNFNILIAKKFTLISIQIKGTVKFIIFIRKSKKEMSYKVRIKISIS